jgi:hypothetical protein
MYRAAPNSTIEIVRILHVRMDLRRYVPSAGPLNQSSPIRRSRG